MTNILLEGLDYHDMIGQVEPKLSVDEYAAKMGKDSDIVTLTFIVNSKLAGDDLVGWLERGYDFVLDASLSDGEIEPGKYLVFAEMNRRTTVPERIINILEDLETLTDIKLKDWSISIEDDTHDADIDLLKQVIVLSPSDYKKNKEKEQELNEYRTLSNLNIKKIYEDDEYIKRIKSMAGM